MNTLPEVQAGFALLDGLENSWDEYKKSMKAASKPQQAPIKWGFDARPECAPTDDYHGAERE